MQKYQVLIVDDETLARELLQDYCAKIPYLEVAGTCANAIEAKLELQQKNIDILLLDIQMPDLTGLELLKLLKNQPATILTTAYSEYALEGFEMEVIDYLLKPIEFDRFFKGISRALEWLGKTASGKLENLQDFPVIREPKENYIFVKSDYKIIKVEFKNILHIEALQKYIRIHTPNKRIVTMLSMNKILEALPEKQFMRIHRSHIINLEKIESIEGNLVQIGKDKLPISKGQRAAFFERINSKFIDNQ